jgi:hypothetical protein
MKIEMTAEGFDPGTELLHFARCCAGFELGTQKNQIAAVEIRLSVPYQPRNTKARRCVVQVHLHAGDRIVAEVMDTDLQVAIHQALERAGWSVTRRLRPERQETGSIRVIEHHHQVASHYEPDRAA